MVHRAVTDWLVPTQTDLDKFWTKVDKSGDCWEWTGATRLGYGIFAVRRNGKMKSFGAHRYIYQIVNEVVLERHQFVCHKCDNPPCVRPDHLFLGSHTDNMNDMYDKGRRPQAKPYQKKETRKANKISYEQYLEIVEALTRPYWGQVNDLAKKYGVRHSMISHIKTGRFVPATVSIHEEN